MLALYGKKLYLAKPYQIVRKVVCACVRACVPASCVHVRERACAGTFVDETSYWLEHLFMKKIETSYWLEHLFMKNTHPSECIVCIHTCVVCVCVCVCVRACVSVIGAGMEISCALSWLGCAFR